MRARAKASLVACSALLLLRLLFFVPEESAVRQARPSLRSSLVIFDDVPSLAPAPAHRLQPAQRSVSAPMRSAARDKSPAVSGSEARTATAAAQSSGSRWGDQRATTFAQYVTLQHAFMNPPPGAKSVRVPGLNNETRPLRYLVVKPCCQLCNRLRVLLSAVALGILTERAVVMDFDRDYYGKFTDLFASPLSPLKGEPPTGVPGARRVRSLGWLHCMQGFLCDDPQQWPEAVRVRVRVRVSVRVRVRVRFRVRVRIRVRIRFRVRFRVSVSLTPTLTLTLTLTRALTLTLTLTLTRSWPSRARPPSCTRSGSTQSSAHASSRPSVTTLRSSSRTCSGLR